MLGERGRAAVQRGEAVGAALRGQARGQRVPRLEWPEGAEPIHLPFVGAEGQALTLGDLAAPTLVERPALVRRHGGSRRVPALANVRVRNLGAFIDEAQVAVAAVPCRLGPLLNEPAAASGGGCWRWPSPVSLCP